jgi:hypothetical protein
MSATGRGGERIEHDNYPTPLWATRRLLEFVDVGARVFEPCAGDGGITRVLRAERASAWICGSDLRTVMRPECDEFAPNTDYLYAGAWRPQVDAVVTNPPYALAEEFVRTAMSHSPRVFALLRLGFLASSKRSAWLRANTPDIYVLPQRPAFAAKWKCEACGAQGLVPYTRATKYHECAVRPPAFLHTRLATDASDYAWFCWSRGETSAGGVMILNDTSAKERNYRE